MGGGPEDDGKPADAPPQSSVTTGPVPRLHDDGVDDTTTVEAGPPATPPGGAASPGSAVSSASAPAPPVIAAPTEADADDRTAQPQLAPVSSTRRPPPPLPSASTRPPLGALTDVTEDLEADEDDEDDDEGDDDDDVTTMAPRLPAGLVLPGSIEIRNAPEDDDEADDETEVRTLPGALTDALDPPTDVTPATSKRFVPSPRPAAGVPASAALTNALPAHDDEDEDDDDGATTQAVLITDKPVEPDTKRITAPEDEDSITTRGPLPGEIYEDESVTSRAPVVSGSPIAKAIDAAKEPRPSMADTVEGPTKKLKRRDGGVPGSAPVTLASPASPADAEPESITTQAPAPLTNMLRVITADEHARVPRLSRDADDDEDDEDDDTQLGGHTAVMPGAPLKRIADQLRTGQPISQHPSPGATLASSGAAGPSALAVAAPSEAVTFDSGLRATRPAPGEVVPSGVHPVGGGPAFAPADPYQGAPYCPGPNGSGPVPLPHAGPQGVGTMPPNTVPPMGSLAPAAGPAPARAPSYGLLVAAVAAICLLVPFALFVMLKAADEAPPTSTTSAAGRGDRPALDPAGTGAKPGVSGAASALSAPSAPGTPSGSPSSKGTASASGSAAGSASQGGKGGRPPGRH